MTTPDPYMEKARKLLPCECGYEEHDELCPAQHRSAVAAALRDAILRERAENMKAVCVHCAANRPVTWLHAGYWHTAKPSGDIFLPEGHCAAAGIRARTAP